MKKNIWLVVLATAVLAGVGYLIGLLWKPSLSNTALYFFSALFQGNAALFAILGVFVVFRLQMERSSITFAMQSFWEKVKRGDFSEDQFWSFKNASLEDKRKILKGEVEDPMRKEGELEVIQPIKEPPLHSWADSEEIILTIRALSRAPIILMAIFMGLSLLCLIFAGPISKTCGAVELMILMGVAGGNIALIGYISRFVYQLLKL